MLRSALVSCLILSFASPAMAQVWTANQRPVVLELARALGEAHGVRKRCDTHDQTWRTRMRDILDREAEDSAFRGPLRNEFNQGYRTSQDAFAGCTDAAKEAGTGAEARATVRLKRLGLPS